MPCSNSSGKIPDRPRPQAGDGAAPRCALAGTLAVLALAPLLAAGEPATAPSGARQFAQFKGGQMKTPAEKAAQKAKVEVARKQKAAAAEDAKAEKEKARAEKAARRAKSKADKPAREVRDADDDEHGGQKRKCPPGQTLTPLHGRGGGAQGCM